MEVRVDQTWVILGTVSRRGFQVKSTWNVQKDVTVAREGTGTRDES